jgi:hypothetical protein
VQATAATRNAWRFAKFKAGLLEEVRPVDRLGAPLLHCQKATLTRSLCPAKPCKFQQSLANAKA